MAGFPRGGGSGASGVDAKKFTVAFDTPNLASGVDTGIVVPAGNYVTSPGMTFADYSAFDGSGTTVQVAPTQALAVNFGTGTILTSVIAGGSATPTDNVFPVGSSGISFYADGDVHLWIAVTDGSGGDPGCTTGEGVLIVEIIAPTAP